MIERSLTGASAVGPARNGKQNGRRRLILSRCLAVSDSQRHQAALQLTGDRLPHLRQLAEKLAEGRGGHATEGVDLKRGQPHRFRQPRLVTEHEHIDHQLKANLAEPRRRGSQLLGLGGRRHCLNKGQIAEFLRNVPVESFTGFGPHRHQPRNLLQWVTHDAT